jgi:hypothetical protein
LRAQGAGGNLGWQAYPIAAGDTLPRLPALLVAVLLVVSGAAGALAQAGGNEPRLALVIGNAAYPGQALKNPAQDARAMARSLRKLGFAVIERIDAGKKAMEDAILEFGEKLREGGIGLFYYAGHGLQVRGRNYLVPVDALLPSEASVRFQAVDIDVVLEQLNEARNRANIVILDACRNNPFVAQLRGAPPGLAAIDAARGTLIAYSTAPGKVAIDGDGANSPYTAGLVRALDVPGLKAEEMFKRVRGYVAEATKGQQTPWESSSLTGDLVLNLNITIAAPPPVPAPANRDAIEAAFWQSIGNSMDAADYEEYLRQFPTGVFSGLAKRRIAEINRKQQQAAQPPRVEAPPPIPSAKTQEAALPPPKIDPPKPPPLPERPRLAIEPVDKEFIATQLARVREAPESGAKVVASLAAGQSVLVTGKVKGESWFQIEREGKPLGFVAAHLLEDAGAYRARQEEGKRKREAAAEEERRRQAAADEERKRQAAAEEAQKRRAAEQEKDRQKQIAVLPPVKEPQSDMKEDQRAWAAIATSSDPEKFAAFLQKYPDSPHAAQAKARLLSLGWSQAQVQAFTSGKAGAPPAASRPPHPPATAPAAAPPAPAAPPTPAKSPPSREDATKQIYDKLIATLFAGKFGTYNPRTAGKPVSNYRSEQQSKVIAMCIDWSGSTITSVVSRGDWLAWEHRMLGEARKTAIDNCVARYQSRGCTCQIIDENDKSVIKVPDEFYQRLARPLSTGEAVPGTDGAKVQPVAAGAAHGGTWKGASSEYDMEIKVDGTAVTGRIRPTRPGVGPISVAGKVDSAGLVSANASGQASGLYHVEGTLPTLTIRRNTGEANAVTLKRGN